MANNQGKRVIFIFFLCIALLAISLCFALTQPLFLSSTIKFFVNKFSPDIHIENLTFRNLEWFSFEKLNLEGFYLKSRIKQEEYVFTSPLLSVDNLEGLLTKAPIIINIQNLSVASEFVKIPIVHIHSNLFFKNFKYQYSFTDFSVDGMKYDQYVLSDVHGNFYNNGQLLFFKKITGGFYSGQFESEGWFRYVSPQGYDVDSRLTHVSSSLLSKVLPSLSQLTAIVDGNVRIKSQKTSGLLIQADLYAPRGGSMKASLLKFLAEYIPQKEQIADLIKHNQEITLEKAQFKLLSISSKDLSSEVILTSPSINLNMNVKFDIHMDGNVGDLLDSLPSNRQASH